MQPNRIRLLLRGVVAVSLALTAVWDALDAVRAARARR